MLLVFAHPDDESFAASGTVAKYVAAGWQADLVCATRGEAGSANGQTTESLGDVRQKELETAGTVIGLSSITFLGYSDGKLTDLNPGELENKVFRQMKNLTPDVVITFEVTNGVSNHPDHRKIGLATTFAFQKYAKLVVKPPAPGRRASAEESFNQALAVGDEPRLYYACLPASIVDFFQKKHLLPSTMFGKPWRGIPDKLVTTVINIRRFRTTKIKALEAHVLQSKDVERFLEAGENPLTLQEYFILRLEGTTEVFMGRNDRVSNRL